MFCSYSIDGSHSCTSNKQTRNTYSAIEKFTEAEDDRQLFALSASTLQIQPGTEVSKWNWMANDGVTTVGSLSIPTYEVKGTFLSELTTKPIYMVYKNTPFVRFQSSPSYLTYKLSTAKKAEYGSRGATVVLVCRYNQFTQFNRTIFHNGNSGNGRVFEWILAENSMNTLHPKFFHRNPASLTYNVVNQTTQATQPSVTSTPGTNNANLPTGKFAVYIFTVTDGLDELYVDGILQASFRSTIPIEDSFVQTFSIGGQLNAPGNMTDIHYAAMYDTSLKSSVTTISNSFRNVCTVLNSR